MKRKDSGSTKNVGVIAVEEPYDMHLEPISSDEDEFTYEPCKLDNEKELCVKTLGESTKSDKQETRKNWTLKGSHGGNKRLKMADRKRKPTALEPVSSDEDEGTYGELTKENKSTKAELNDCSDYGDDADDSSTSSEEDTQTENKEKRSRKWFREREQEQMLQKSPVDTTEPAEKTVPKIPVTIELS